MAFREYVTTITDTLGVLDGTQYPTWIMKNMSDTSVVYLGDGAVTDANGWPIQPGDIYSPSELAHKSITGRLEERLSAICSSGETAEVRVYVQGAIRT